MEYKRSTFQLGLQARNVNKSEKNKDNIYIDMQAGRNLLPKLLVADN